MSEPKHTPGPWRTDSVSPFDSDFARRLASPAELREMVQTLTRERDEARELWRREETRMREAEWALDAAGVSATAPMPPGVAGCQTFSVAERIGTLAAQRDEARADAARLRGALETLSTVERHYRDMYQRHGGQALDTGRAWDMLRKAGIEARAALAGEGEAKRCAWTYDETHCAWDSACGEKWILMDGGPAENRIRYCHGCGRQVQADSADPPEKARQP